MDSKTLNHSEGEYVKYVNVNVNVNVNANVNWNVKMQMQMYVSVRSTCARHVHMPS